MSEKVLRAVKIERPETPCVKYTMQVSASFAEDELFPVPEKYIAHILANNLREYVMYAVTDESIAKILKSGIPTVCPKCGREMVDDGKMAHGTLTAEQVRECVQVVYFEGYSDGTVNRGQHLEETDWQAIADELNARAERTCRDASVDSSTQFYCSLCECTVDIPLLWGEVNYCPNCGRKVERGDA